MGDSMMCSHWASFSHPWDESSLRVQSQFQAIAQKQELLRSSSVVSSWWACSVLGVVASPRLYRSSCPQAEPLQERRQ
jgi:hypothetical protein